MYEVVRTVYLFDGLILVVLNAGCREEREQDS
jgi:hypothetical protein